MGRSLGQTEVQPEQTCEECTCLVHTKALPTQRRFREIVLPAERYGNC